MAESSIEQRKHARIESSIACTVATSADAFEAVIANLSKGGAAIIGPEGAARIADTVTLMLERPEGLLNVSFTAKVVRMERKGERVLYGVAFDALPPHEDAQLAMLIQMVARGKGPGRRVHPRVSTRLEVNCHTEALFRGYLNDLSRGGLSLRSNQNAAIGDEIDVSIGVQGIDGIVEVTGTVVSSQKVEGSFRLGLKFHPMDPKERSEIDRVLEVLLSLRVANAEIVDDGS